MRQKNKLLPALAFLMGLFIFTLSGCGSLSKIVLPSPPVFSEETARPTKTPRPSPSPTRSPAPTPAPVSVKVAAASPSPSPFVTEPPQTTGAPVAASADYDAATQQEAAVPVSASPVLTIEQYNLPSDMTQGGVFSLSGIIRSDCGSINYVVGTLYHASGEMAQQAEYYPDSNYFSLAGTVNSALRFASLAPDTYIYQVCASAVNGDASSDAILINHSFSILQPTVPVSSGQGSQISYDAKLSSDTDNAALIWNYFIEELDNPYAAAAILGNIYTESACDPMRVEGDLTGSFSKDYTSQVDAGSVSRDSFTGLLPGDKYGHGYGLCQWSGERKELLYDLAVTKGCSVGDLAVQCEFIMMELTVNYPTLLDYLLRADDAEAAAFEFCNVYEKAAVHGGRTGYAKDYLEKYAA